MAHTHVSTHVHTHAHTHIHTHHNLPLKFLKFLVHALEDLPLLAEVVNMLLQGGILCQTTVEAFEVCRTHTHEAHDDTASHHAGGTRTLSNLFSSTLILFHVLMCCCWLLSTCRRHRHASHSPHWHSSLNPSDPIHPALDPTPYPPVSLRCWLICCCLSRILLSSSLTTCCSSTISLS